MLNWTTVFDFSICCIYDSDYSSRQTNLIDKITGLTIRMRHLIKCQAFNCIVKFFNRFVEIAKMLMKNTCSSTVRKDTWLFIIEQTVYRVKWCRIFLLSFLNDDSLKTFVFLSLWCLFFGNRKQNEKNSKSKKVI